MKKVFALVMALVLVLSLAACGGGSSGSGEKDLKVGDTAEGKICNVTINSVDFVDKIEDGAKRTVYHKINGLVNNDDYFEDITAENGYSIVKITYSFEYTGKKESVLNLGFTLDYDGYTFDSYNDHALPKEETDPAAHMVSLWKEIKYTDLDKTSFEVKDPISYKGDKGEKYIIISDEVKNNADKPYVLKVDVSLVADNTQDNAQTENFVFDLR